MPNKLNQWLSLQKQVDKHLENAGAAIEALDGQDKVVTRNLLRIIRREHDLADFAMIVSESKAFEIQDEKDL